MDRSGFPVGFVIREEDGTLAQADLISKGIAWAFSTDTSRAMMDPLRRIEAQARSEQKGFWTKPEYALQTTDTVGNYPNSFQVVEGKILNAEVKRIYTFFSFGKDWRTDFTVRILNKNWGKYTARKDNPLNLTVWRYSDPREWIGRTIRVRGWVEENDGPMITMTHPEQIEIVRQPSPSAK